MPLAVCYIKGAIFGDGNSSVRIEGSAFSGNSAERGGEMVVLLFGMENALLSCSSGFPLGVRFIRLVFDVLYLVKLRTHLTSFLHELGAVYSSFSSVDLEGTHFANNTAEFGGAISSCTACAVRLPTTATPCCGTFEAHMVARIPEKLLICGA